jgi:gelsolin
MEYRGKVLKIEDTNIAYLGSELEKKVKLAAASQEIAWKGIGTEPGLTIWRIEKFNVVVWPKEEYGSFYSGDSYIILQTYNKKGGDELLFNAHMWVGTFTTMDEAGTAAYKIVELDDVFDRKVVLFREAQGFESETFLSYFKTIKIMDGGIESGFKKVPVESYKPRLLHVRKCKKDFRVSEVTLTTDSLDTDDIFILDAGLTIYKWIGSKSNSFEKFRAASICEEIKNERIGKPVIVELEESNNDETFWKILGGRNEIKSRGKSTGTDGATHSKNMFRLSDSSGELLMTTVEYAKSSLSSDDVFIIDAGSEILIWIGNKTTANEKKNSIAIAQQYIKDYGRPSQIPFSVMSEGRENCSFNSAF